MLFGRNLLFYYVPYPILRVTGISGTDHFHHLLWLGRKNMVHPCLFFKKKAIRVPCSNDLGISSCRQRQLQVELPEFKDIWLEEEPAEGGKGEKGTKGYPGTPPFFLFEHGSNPDN